MAHLRAVEYHLALNRTHELLDRYRRTKLRDRDVEFHQPHFQVPIPTLYLALSDLQREERIRQALRYHIFRFQSRSSKQNQEEIQYVIDQLHESNANQNVKITKSQRKKFDDNHKHLNHKIDALQGKFSREIYPR